MKTILKIATVLTWFNIIVWGAVVTSGLLGALAQGQMLYVAAAVLLSSIPLNCYASLKLQRSIRYSNIPLSHETPVGIRFVGLMAFFIGIIYLGAGLLIISDPKSILDAMKEMPAKLSGVTPEEMASMGKVIVLSLGVILVVLGLLVAVNVNLNLRLLRWYYLVHKSDVS
jgi:hypothetical protein